MGCRLMCQCEWPAGEIGVHSAWLGEESRQKVCVWGRGVGMKQDGGIERVRVKFNSKDGGSHWREKTNRPHFYFRPFDLLR